MGVELSSLPTVTVEGNNGGKTSLTDANKESAMSLPFKVPVKRSGKMDKFMEESTRASSATSLLAVE
uniref:Ovule protein n=1 Tax=Steinernema glaseri TaxID=37863 RepID=A0A1I7ZL64_9BILA